jgi:hypothetical protein
MSTDPNPAPVDLDEVRRLCEAASDGPWVRDGHAHDDGEEYWDVDGPNGGWIAHVGEPEDGEFIVAARDLVPQMAEEIKRLRAERDRPAQRQIPPSGTNTWAVAPGGAR